MKMRNYSCTEILIVSLSITGSIGLITYYGETQNLGREAYQAQKNVLTSRADLFKNAKESLISTIINHLGDPEFQDQTINVLSSKRRFRPGTNNTQTKLTGNIDTSKIFQQNIAAESISILTPGAIFSLSTDIKKVGRYQPVQNTTTYIDPQKSVNSSLRFFKDPLSGRPTTTLAFPIRDNTNKRRGYYAVDVNPKTLYESMFTPGDVRELDPPERTLAIAYTSLSRTTEIYNPNNATEYPALKSEGITNALSNRKGTYLYLNHEQKPVVGAYQYIPAANMALLVEREQAILFKKARQRLVSILLFGGLASLIAFASLKRFKSYQNTKQLIDNES